MQNYQEAARVSLLSTSMFREAEVNCSQTDKLGRPGVPEASRWVGRSGSPGYGVAAVAYAVVTDPYPGGASRAEVYLDVSEGEPPVIGSVDPAKSYVARAEMRRAPGGYSFGPWEFLNFSERRPGQDAPWSPVGKLTAAAGT